ncbi:NAD-P-binding protein [Sparassis latifolia]|uniref:Versicolorin reductase n=1 Tax=Sparassis crispa TaxID=139825 RepID=A0A401H1A4_9APHY|nr:Versicolorin reductase [Sparassis crispa]GBE88160.1 Versicolorin reductase [Sparassis crispa]
MSTTHIALVTGASRGIGEAIALRLAEDGYDLALNDLAPMADGLAALVKKVQLKGRRAVAILGDVSHEHDVKAMVDKAVHDLGGLDVMVANAGILILDSVLETSVKDFNRVMSINVLGTFLCFKYAAMQMIKQGRGGRIIGASSLAGKTGAYNLSAYSCSKFAIRALTQTCAIEWAEHGITVNSYAPGLIHTAMVATPDDPKRTDANKFKESLHMPANLPEADPSAIAGLVSYLIRPESQFISGQCVNINGGSFFD